LSPLQALIVNGTLFNLSWFVIVFTHSPVIAPLQVAGHLLVHSLILGRGSAEARFLLLVTVIGVSLDQLLFLGGVLAVEGPVLPAPLWLSCLWPVFATTLCHAFRGLAARPLLAAVIGGLGGAGSYVAGVRLSDVAFASFPLSAVILGLTWAALFPLLLKLGVRMVPVGENNRA